MRSGRTWDRMDPYAALLQLTCVRSRADESSWAMRLRLAGEVFELDTPRINNLLLEKTSTATRSTSSSSSTCSVTIGNAQPSGKKTGRAGQKEGPARVLNDRRMRW